MAGLRTGRELLQKAKGARSHLGRRSVRRLASLRAQLGEPFCQAFFPSSPPFRKDAFAKKRMFCEKSVDTVECNVGAKRNEQATLFFRSPIVGSSKTSDRFATETSF